MFLIQSGFTLVDFSVPARDVAMTHPPSEAPLCEDVSSERDGFLFALGNCVMFCVILGA